MTKTIMTTNNTMPTIKPAITPKEDPVFYKVGGLTVVGVSVE